VPAQSQAVPTYDDSVSGQISQVATNVALQVYNDVNYSQFLKFNPTLGTLNSVTFYVDSLEVSGSIFFDQGSATGTSVIRGFTGDVSLWKGTIGSGAYNGLASDYDSADSSALTVTSHTLPTNVARNNSETFVLADSQSLLTSPLSFNVSSGDFTGSGSAPTFTLNVGLNADWTQSANPPGFDFAGVSPIGGLRLVYDYTPAIPEPSTYGIGLGVLALAAVAIRRRNKVKA
jgi:hypothetical protein